MGIENNTKLCKLLGIEPRHIGKSMNDFKMDKIILYTQETYPDLTAPENFVKLLQVFSDNDEQPNFKMCHHKAEGNNGDVIDFTIDWAIWVLSCSMDNVIGNLQQQAQQIEWKY